MIALATVLAMGAASAQPTATAPVAQSTVAGTRITNIAKATFTDPTTGQPATPVQSNPVVTVVNPVPDFTITPNGTQDAPGQELTGKTPGSTVEFPYNVTNTGNTPIIVELTSTDRTDTDVQNIQYYVDADGNPETKGDRTLLTDTDGDGKVEVRELAPSATAKIIQVYTIPADATSTQQFGANPVGTAVYDNDATDGTAVGSLTNPDAAAVTAAGTTTEKVDNDNFNRVTLVTPGLVTAPPTDPTNPGTTTPVFPPNDPTLPPITNGGNVTPPPTSGTPGDPTAGNGVPTAPVNPGATPGDPVTDQPSVPGYQDPNPNTPGVPTNIEIKGNEQIAYPPADGNTTPDVVNFINRITNTGTQDDIVTILDPIITGDTTGVTVVLTKPDGTPLDEDPNTDGIQVKVPAGGTVYYETTVTYPDNDGSTALRNPIKIEIPVDSGLDGDNLPNTSTFDTIMPPAMHFGDTSSLNGLDVQPTPEPVNVVTPPATGSVTTSFPMSITNPGAYNDTYTLTGSVPINGVDVPVVYYYNGQPLPTDGNGNYITPVVASGGTLNIEARIEVPAGTPAGDYIVNQTATSNYSGITLTDTNDIIRVSPTGNVALAKFQKNGTAPTTMNGIDANSGYGAGQTTVNPGANIEYQIIGKNSYNAPVTNFAICDAAPANTTFVSIADTDGIANIYRANGAWSATAPVAGTAGEICIANDADGNGLPDALPAGATYTVNFTAKVN